MSEKVEVNGDERHEIYAQLVETPNEKGETGDVQWNFEKFLIGADGAVVARFNPGVEPDDAQITGQIESLLACIARDQGHRNIDWVVVGANQ